MEATWLALRSAIGRSGLGAMGTSIEDAWRESKASGLAIVLSMAERAALQSLPMFATDHLPALRNAFRVFGRSSAEATRRALTAALTFATSALVLDLRARLSEIDPGLDVLTPTEDDAGFVHYQQSLSSAGHVLGSWQHPGGEDWGASQFPAFATHYVLRVLWSGTSAGVPDPAKLKVVRRLLDDALPGWCDYVIVTSVGFRIGESLVGWTGLDDEMIREPVDVLAVDESLSVGGDVALAIGDDIA